MKHFILTGILMTSLSAFGQNSIFSHVRAEQVPAGISYGVQHPKIENANLFKGSF